jgi:hypothetical protein
MMTVRSALDAALEAPDLDDDEALATEDLVEVEADEEEASAAPPGSVLAVLRAKAHDAAASQTIDLPLPWFDGMLVGRYQAIPMSRIYRVGRNGQLSNPLADSGLAADALALACVELFQTDGQGGPLETIGDYPCRYDDSLADALRLDLADRSARAVMYALYAASGRSEAFIVRHFTEYFTWLSGEVGEEVAEEAVGEFRPQ